MKSEDIPQMLPVGKTCMDCQFQGYCSKWVDTLERRICAWGPSRFLQVETPPQPRPA